MKTVLKIAAITLLVTVLLLISAVSYAVWFAFTPDKLTPFVKKQADNLLTCDAHIGEVELTFFSTFPEFGLKIKDFALYNTENGASPDTLVSTEELVCVVDIKSLINSNNLSIGQLLARNGNINIYTDSMGVANYNILKDSEPATTPTDEGSVNFNLIDISGLSIDNINLSYIDKQLNIDAQVEGFTAELNGSLTNDLVKSRMIIKNSSVNLSYCDTAYLSSAKIKLDIDSEFDMNEKRVEIENGTLSLNGLTFNLSGDACYNSDGSSAMNLKYGFEKWELEKILTLIPDAYRHYVADIRASGLISSQGTIAGRYDSINIPAVNAMLLFTNGQLQYPTIGIPISAINTNITASVDKQNPTASVVTINGFEASTPKSKFSLTGQITDIWNDPAFSLTTNSSVVIDEFNKFIPAELKTTAKGLASGEIKGTFTLSQLEKIDLNQMKLSGKLNLKDLDIRYDSITVATNKSVVDFSIPNVKEPNKGISFLYAHIKSENLNAAKINSFDLEMGTADITVKTSDVRDSTSLPEISSTFKIGSLKAMADTNKVKISNPQGKVELLRMGKDNKRPKIVLEYKSDGISAQSGSSQLKLDRIDLNTTALHALNGKNIMSQWIAKGDFKLDNADITISGINQPIKIPQIDVDFSPAKLHINKSRLNIGKSDFALTGQLMNIVQYFKGDSILRGKFDFVSSNTDINQLMSLTSGLGSDEDSAATDDDGMPYMVPKGIDIELETNIRQATFNVDTATAIKGTLRVNDGLLVLDQMNFITPAAKMQLTAMYRTPRKNHLFAAFDYHMTNVEIAELLKMIPDIDSLMPMLRSFGGKGEFHIAAQTNLDSAYNIKKSTLRGVSSIKGQDLILMDGETFSEIAKTLKFSKKTENRVDSLSAEFTIFKKEIDIYPFLIVMDKYKAVVSGQHNFDMNFNYHISVVDCPLPLKLGVDVSGTPDLMKYRLAKCRYKEFYRPASRKLLENKQLEIRRMIRESLLKKVADQPST